MTVFAGVDHQCLPVESEPAVDNATSRTPTRSRDSTNAGLNGRLQRKTNAKIKSSSSRRSVIHRGYDGDGERTPSAHETESRQSPTWCRLHPRRRGSLPRSTMSRVAPGTSTDVLEKRSVNVSPVASHITHAKKSEIDRYWNGHAVLAASRSRRSTVGWHVESGRSRCGSRDLFDQPT